MTDAGPQIRFTPTQLRIVQLLADGKAHSRKEIHGLLWDEQSSPTAIQAHISACRKMLRLMREDIICELNGVITYRRVRYLDISESTSPKAP